MRLSVVIPTYNRKEILLECLRALDSQTLLKDRYEVLVVDNGSTDQSVAIAKKCGVSV